LVEKWAGSIGTVEQTGCTEEGSGSRYRVIGQGRGGGGHQCEVGQGEAELVYNRRERCEYGKERTGCTEEGSSGSRYGVIGQGRGGGGQCEVGQGEAELVYNRRERCEYGKAVGQKGAANGGFLDGRSKHKQVAIKQRAVHVQKVEPKTGEAGGDMEPIHKG
jgi:hypothetical protein